MGHICFMLCIFILYISILTHAPPSPPFLTFGARHSHGCGRLYACSPPGGTQCPPFTVLVLVINTHYYYLLTQRRACCPGLPRGPEQAPAPWSPPSAACAPWIVLFSCLNPKEPPTGTQACSPCCTPTWSRRMRHWNARARARRDPRYAPQTRDAKWARGSRSQTHRRAAKGGFTQTTVRWSEGLVPDRCPPPLFLRRFLAAVTFFINVSQY